MSTTTPDPDPTFFAFWHLPEPLREVSQLFAELAEELVERLPDHPERAVALRKLLESKDAAVRTKVWALSNSPAGDPR